MPSSMPSLSSAPSMSAVPTTLESTNLYRINCGGPNFTDSNGNLWLADADKDSPYSDGGTKWKPSGTPPAIDNTVDDVLFQTGTSPPKI